MDTLFLEVTHFTDETRWSWQLTSSAGEFLARHDVSLDRATAEYEGFTDLYGYLHWHATPGKGRRDRLMLEADVGRWIGAQVFGDIGPAIAAHACAGPVVVRVVVPDEARILFVRPFELAYAGDQPLALQGVALVLEPADPRAGRSPQPGMPHPDRPLRILAVFSLPEDEQALALRWERHQLTSLIHRLREAQGAAIDLRIVQYGVTYERLASILSEPEGWDVIHISGHGLPGGLFLEQADGGRDLIGSSRLIGLLGRPPSLPKLVMLTSCESAAADTAAPLLRHGLSRAAHLPAGDTAHGLPLGARPHMLADLSSVTSDNSATEAALARAEGPPREARPLPTLASELARRLGCAVVAMRYRISDEFALQLTEGLYSHMLVDGDPLPRALQRTVEALAPIGPALTVTSAALFGSASATLKLSAPQYPGAAAGLAVRRNKLADLPPQPERFVGRIGTMTRASSALAADNAARAVVFHGMPGAGKTACALELAHTHEDAFEEFLWYQVPKDADNPRHVLQAFLGFLHDKLPGILEAPARADTDAFCILLSELSGLLARRAVLLIIDGIEPLITPGGSWRDEQWPALAEALVSHDGASRLVLTSRYRPPVIGSQAEIEPVCPLSQFEGGILGLQLNEFRALVIGDAGLDTAEGAMLLADTVFTVHGHPGLIEIAAGLAGHPDTLRRRLDAVGQAWEADRVPVTSFLHDEPTGRAGKYLDAIESWSADVRGTLPQRTAVLFDILCAVEEADCGDFGGRIAWGEFWRRRGDSEPADFDDHLRVLHDAALIDVPRATGDGFRAFRLHPAVAVAGRSLADPGLQSTVDQAMATFLYSGYFHTLNSEADHLGDMVRLFGERALPYLLRAGRLEDVSGVLTAVVKRDQSRKVVAEVLPLLRRVAAAAGTSAELAERAHLAQAESLIDPEASEAELRDLLQLAEDTQHTSLALTIMTDLTRVSREAGRLDEALSWADRAIALARDTGSGPWMELRLEIPRLQIQILRGEAEQVLARVDDLVPIMAEATVSEPGAGSATVPRDGPASDYRETRETLLNTGMVAAGRLGQWEKMLAFSASLMDSMAARSASPLDRAGIEFMTYQPLVGMGRLGEARDLLRRCREIFAEHHDDGLLGKATGALSDVESRLGHHHIAIRLGEQALGLAYASADLLDIVSSHSLLARLAQDDPATALAHNLAAAIIAYEARLGSLGAHLKVVASRLADDPERELAPGSFAGLCEMVGQVRSVDLGGLHARLWPGKSGDEALSGVLRAADLIELPPSYLDPHLRYWDRVIAAMFAAGLGADGLAEPGGDRALPWVERTLRAREDEGKWAALARVLRRIIDGERDTELAEGLNPIGRAVVRRTLDVLAGSVTVSARARTTWRILDYLDSRGLGQSGGISAGGARKALPSIGPIADMLAVNDDIRPTDRASMLFDLASRVAVAGLHKDACALLRRAVAGYRLLAQEDPEKFGPDLATALNRLAGELLNLGFGEDAIATGREALAVRRKLAATGSAVLERDLAAGLNNLGGLLSRWAGPSEGLPLFRESAEIYRRLASSDPGEDDLELITALRNLSTGLSGLGRIDEARTVIQDAVAVARRLAASDPAAHEPALAAALTDLEACWSRLGQSGQAAAAAREAAALYRHLANQGGAVYEAGLGKALSALGVHLSRTGRGEEGYVAATESVSILARLRATSPAIEGDLALAQNRLAGVLSKLDRPDEAAAALRSAAEINRRLTRRAPGEFEPSLATTLNNLAIILTGQHAWREVRAVAAEAIPLLRRLAVSDPAEYEPTLAESLSFLAYADEALDENLDEAIATLTESVETYRRLADASPQGYAHRLEYASLTLKKLLLERDKRSLKAELSAMQAISEQIERNRPPGLAAASTHQHAALVFDPAAFGETAANAVVHAAPRRRGAALDTRAVLLALMHVDALGDWSRIWLNARSPELAARAEAQDPDQAADGHWGDAELTGTLTSALLIATRISREYGLGPVPAGVLALGLIANPAAAAARALGVGDGTDHGLLVNLVQEALIGAHLEDLDLTE